MRRWLLWSLGLFLAASILGGSAFWHVIGLGGDLTIDGRAPAIAQPDPSLGQGWGAYGGEPGGNRYTAAGQITRGNVGRLQLAWDYRAGMPDAAEIDQWAFEATPILVGNALVLCTPYNEVIALDPGSGRQLWRFDPKVRRDLNPGNQYTCRGVSAWRGEGAESCATRVFMGTVDNRLIALDAATGRHCAGFGEGGEVRIDPGELRWPGEFQITSAPAIVGDIVVVGSAISDNETAAAPSGAVRAFDVRTGAPRWEFDPLADTGAVSGHANVWSTISVDERRGLVFLPTSSASPDFFGGLRAGKDGHANSIVALDGATGKLAWSFQAVHHDLWDYDLPAQPGLYRVWRGGAWHDVVAAVGKTGLVFVLDRESGRPFLPVEERPVPQGGVAGEALSPTQPFPVNTPPLVPDRFSLKDSFGITLWDRLACMAKARNLRREGLFTPPALGGTLAYPFSGGGANWGSTAYDPARNLMVVNLSNAAHIVTLAKRADFDAAGGTFKRGAERAPMDGTPYGVGRELLASPLGLPCTPPPWGVIAGVDLASGKIVWRRTLGTTEDVAPGGLSLPLGTPNFGGPMVTAGGLVFVGAAMDDYLRALDVETGLELWKARLPAGPQATPMSYVWQGRQYVVIVAGGHAKSDTRRGDHVMAFALPDP